MSIKENKNLYSHLPTINFFKKIFFIFSFVWLSLTPSYLFAEEIINLDGPSLLPRAEIFTTPATGDFQLGSTFDASIYINTEGRSINTVRIELSFNPSKLSIIKSTGGNSALGIWFEVPTYDNQNGTASITEVIPNGIITNSGLVTTVTFKALALGETTVNIIDYSSANLNDGIGSNVILTLNGATYNIIPAEENFCITHPSDPTCIIPTFCTLNPTNPACIAPPPFCTLHPTDPACVVPLPFCTLYPTNPACITPLPFCTLHPTNEACVAPLPFCTRNPTDPACIAEPFCVLNPTDPSCIPEPFCTRHPDDLACLAPKEANTVSETVTNSIKIITNAIDKAKVETSKVLNTPKGNIASKIITTTGVITGTTIGLATGIFANTLTFWQLFLIPFRLWSLILIALGIRKRNVPWGTVYDSVTKQPLDPAYVALQDLNGNEVATSITDLDGRYGFFVPSGNYRLVANKTNYEFPSKKLAGKEKDEVYDELYFNEIIEVKEGGVITRNIPMDPLRFDWNEFAKHDQNLMKFFRRRDIWIARISDVLFFFGLLIAMIATITTATTFNIVILIIYLVVFILKRTILKKSHAFGYIKQKGSKSPRAFAIIRVFFEGSDEEVAHKVADKTGKYYCLVPNGRYYTKIENKNLDESYSLVNTSEPIEVKNGYINKKFEV